MVFDVRPDIPAGLGQPIQPDGGVVLKDARGRAVISELFWIVILAAASVGLTYGFLFARGARELRSQPWMFLGLVCVIILFDAIFLGIIWKLSHSVLRYIRFGAPKIRLSAYPLIFGREFSVSISDLPQGLEQLNLTLRCLGERSCRYQDKGEDKWITEYYSLYRLDGPMAIDVDRTGAHFSSLLPHLPDLATRAGDPCSILWDLVIGGKRRGLDFEARFIIPVFSATEG